MPRGYWSPVSWVFLTKCIHALFSIGHMALCHTATILNFTRCFVFLQKNLYCLIINQHFLLSRKPYFPCLFQRKKKFFYLKIKVAYREGDREIFYLPDYFPNSLAGQKLRTRRCLWVSHMGERSQGTDPSSIAFPVHHWKLDQR